MSGFPVRAAGRVPPLRRVETTSNVPQCVL